MYSSVLVGYVYPAWRFSSCILKFVIVHREFDIAIGTCAGAIIIPLRTDIALKGLCIHLVVIRSLGHDIVSRYILVP